MASIYDLSWCGTSFLSKLVLFVESQKQAKLRMQAGDSHTQSNGCSALSSTYYSIAGTAFSKLKATLRPKWLVWLAPVRIALWLFTWLPLATWCYLRMLPLSNRVVQLIGHDRMPVDQLDVRQSILRRHGKYKDATECIFVALSRNPLEPHTRGLLNVGLAEIAQRDCNNIIAVMMVESALDLAKEAEQDEPRQSARIYRSCAKILVSINKGNRNLGNELRNKAKSLAQATGADDQMLKMM